MPVDKELGLHQASTLNRLLNDLHLRQITPPDICDHPDLLCKRFSRLFGDPDFGHGNDGHCQSWQGDWRWSKEFLRDRGVIK